MKFNKLAKLVDAIAISKSETVTDSLTDPLTDRGNCWQMLSHLKIFLLTTEPKYKEAFAPPSPHHHN